MSRLPSCARGVAYRADLVKRARGADDPRRVKEHFEEKVRASARHPTWGMPLVAPLAATLYASVSNASRLLKEQLRLDDDVKSFEGAAENGNGPQRAQRHAQPPAGHGFRARAFTRSSSGRTARGPAVGWCSTSFYPPDATELPSQLIVIEENVAARRRRWRALVDRAGGSDAYFTAARFAAYRRQ